MSNIQIERINSSRTPRVKLPWSEMAVGEGFRIARTDRLAKSIRQAVYAANKRFEKKGLPNRFITHLSEMSEHILVERVS